MGRDVGNARRNASVAKADLKNENIRVFMTNVKIYKMPLALLLNSIANLQLGVLGGMQGVEEGGGSGERAGNGASGASGEGGGGGGGGGDERGERGGGYKFKEEKLTHKSLNSLD